MGMIPSIFKASKNHVELKISDTSLLALNFNKIMVEAYNEKCSYFVILHSDIEILTVFWIDKMVNIMQTKDLGVLSVVSPIKSEKGLTSTALDMETSIRKLSMFEISMSLPLTFTSIDTFEAFNNGNLLINTGVICVDTSKVDPTQCYFSIEDRIIKKDEKYDVTNISEDWNFSRMLIKNKVKYGATREISIKHYGNTYWDNTTVKVGEK